MSDLRSQTAPTMQHSEPRRSGGFIWYELMSPDPVGSKHFYDAVVGWDIEPEPAGDLDYRMIRRSDGGLAGGVLRLTEDMTTHGAFATWLGYLYVDDVDQTLSAVSSAGGKAWMPATDIPNVGRVAMLSDAQGAPFYVMKPTPPAGNPDAQSDVFSPDAQQRVGWNELQTPNVEEARRFYGEQFGWDTDEFMDMGEMGKYYFIHHNGQRIGALFGTNDGQPARFRFYFRVPSIAAAKQAAEDHGGTMQMGPHQVPTGDWIVIGRDPQGAEFALVGGE